MDDKTQSDLLKITTSKNFDAARISQDAIYDNLGFKDKIESIYRDNIIGGALTTFSDFQFDNSYMFRDANRLLKSQIEETVDKNQLINDAYKNNIKTRAKGINHLNALIEEGERKSMQDRYTNDTGFIQNLPLYLVSGITEIAPLIAVSAANPALGAATTAGRLSRYASMALGTSSNFAGRMGAGMAYQGMIEGMYNQVSPKERSLEHLIINTLSAGVFNGILGSKSVSELEIEQSKSLIRSILRDKFGISKKQVGEVETLFKKGRTEEGKQKLNEFLTNSASGEPVSKTIADGLAESLEKGSLTKSAYEALRVDMQFLTRESESKTFSRLSKEFFYDNAFGDMGLDGKYLGVEANLIRHQISSNFTTEFAEIRKEFAEEVAKANGNMSYLSGIIEHFRSLKDDMFSILGEARMQKQFGSLRISKGNDDEAISYMAQVINQKYNIEISKALELAKKLNNAGNNFALKSHEIMSKYNSDFASGKIKANKDYMNIEYSPTKFQKLVKDYGIGNVFTFWKKSFTSNFSEEVLKKLETDKEFAKEFDGVLKRWINQTFSNSSPSIYKEILEGSALAKDIETLLEKHLGYTKNDAKTASSLMFRKDFDRTIEHSFEGAKKGTIKYTDFIDTNLDSLVEKYAREVSGRNALSKFKIQLPREKLDETGMQVVGEDGSPVIELQDVNVKTDKEIRELVDQIDNELKAKVNNGVITENQKLAEMLRLEHILKSLTAKPTAENPFGSGQKVLDILKNLTNAKLLGQIIFSMPAEVINTFSRVGVTAMASAFKDTFGIVKAIKTGKIKNEEIQEIMDTFGYGYDYIRGTGSMRYDSAFGTQLGEGGTMLEKAQNYSEIFAEATYNISGMKPLTAILQISSVMAMQRQIVKFAKTGIKDDFILRFQKDLNISDEMLERISLQFRNSLEPRNAIDDMRAISDKINGESEIPLSKNKTFDFYDVKHIEELITLGYSNANIKTILYRVNKGKNTPKVIAALRELGYDSIFIGKKDSDRKIHLFEKEETKVVIEEPKLVKQEPKFDTTVEKVNYNKWTDVEAREQWEQSVRILTDSLVQLGSLQDDVGVKGFGNQLLTNTIFGKMFLSLKTYMIQAYTKQLGRSANTFDMNIALGVLAQGVALYSAALAQNTINYAGTELYDKKTDSEFLMKTAINRLSVSSYIPQLLDLASFALIKEPIMGEGRYHKLSDNITRLMAPLSIVDDLWKAPSIPINILSGKGAEAEYDAWGLAPNYPIVAGIKAERMEELKEEKAEANYLERLMEEQ